MAEFHDIAMSELSIPYTAGKEYRFDQRLRDLEASDKARSKEVSSLRVTLEATRESQSRYTHELQLFRLQIETSISENNKTVLDAVKALREEDTNREISELQAQLNQKQEAEKYTRRTLYGLAGTLAVTLITSVVRYFFS